MTRRMFLQPAVIFPRVAQIISAIHLQNLRFECQRVMGNIYIHEIRVWHISCYSGVCLIFTSLWMLQCEKFHQICKYCQPLTLSDTQAPPWCSLECSVRFLSSFSSSPPHCQNRWMIIFKVFEYGHQVAVYHLNADFNYLQMQNFSRLDPDCLHTSLTTPLTMPKQVISHFTLSTVCRLSTK